MIRVEIDNTHSNKEVADILRKMGADIVEKKGYQSSAYLSDEHRNDKNLVILRYDSPSPWAEFSIENGIEIFTFLGSDAYCRA